MRLAAHLLSFFLLAAALQPLAAEEKPFAFGSVRFEANRGQAGAGVRYITRARAQQIFLTDDGITFAPKDGPPVRMTFAGAGVAHWLPASPPADSISYYIGSDPAKWVKQAPVYDRILWRGVYPGVDAIFYGHQDTLEYDLVIAPGADSSRLRLSFDGPARIHTRPDGTIEIGQGSGAIRQRAPDIYQERSGGKRQRVAGRFVPVGAHAVRLELGRYDRSKSLVVDPVIEAATYLGGENDDEIIAIADGCVAGNTRSLAFPVTNPTLRQDRDVFIRGTGPANPVSSSRFSFTGTLVLGGSGDDELTGVVLDNNGTGYLAGATTSTDFPSANASKYKGGASDGFIAFVNVSQFLSLNSSLYIGGSGKDRINSFTGGSSLIAFAGETDSPDLPAFNTPQNTIGGGKDAFYGVIYPNIVATPVYGYLGGAQDDTAYAISIRSFQEIWIGGETRSADFPFTEPGLAGPSDAFIAKITTLSFVVPQGSQPVPAVKISSYRIGGNGEDSIRALVATPSTITSSIGSVSIIRPFIVDGIGFAGVTTSDDLPLRNPAQSHLGGDRDGFVGMWDATAGASRWLTYVGGSGPDEASAIAQNWAGDLYVGGWTRSPDLPVIQAIQPAPAGGEDGMFALYDAAGTLRHLTYYGGSGDDRIRGARAIYNSVSRLAGSTTSTDLPQRLPWQDRGLQSDGFVVDIGTDYLIGPTDLILAKDGMVSFSLRAGRTAYRESVTYHSSDPSRVRFVYLGRSLDEVTAALEDNMSLEALADSGEVEITATAPGYPTKSIRVKLYPGAFMPSFNAATDSLSTWAVPTSLFANYRAIDPATGQPTGFSFALRPGITPVFNWTLSDSSAIELLNTNGAMQLHALKSGEARLSLSVEGFHVIQGDQRITAATPRLLQPASDIRIGQNLYAGLPITFGVNSLTIFSGYHGTLTARSGDPSRLLLSLAQDQAGRESVSVTMNLQPPVIWAQALAGEGSVQVFFTSSEFEGDVPVTVFLEKAVLKWGFNKSVSGVTTIDQSGSLTVSTNRTGLALSLQGESGSYASGYRPGAPPLTVKLSNSNPQVIELNRLTATSFQDGYTIRPVAPGSADLTLTLASDTLRLLNPTVHVDVSAPESPVSFVTLPTSVWVGKGLQTSVSFRYQSREGYVDLLSDDASAVLVSASAKTIGSDHLTLQSPNPNSDSFTFYLQALKSDGNVRVRLRFPTGEEKEIKAVLKPTAVGFVGFTTASSSSGSRSAGVVAWALDRESGVGVYRQTPQPGPGVTVRFRSEGAPVKLSRDSLVLTVDAPFVGLDYALLAPGEQATLIAEPDGVFTTSPFVNRLQIAGDPVFPDPVNFDNIVLARDELRKYSLPPTTSLAPMTVTSTDPERVLISTTEKDAPSASLQSPAPIAVFYIHALAATGSSTLRIESPGAATREVKVALQPLLLNVYGSPVPLGGSSEYTMSLSASSGLRPSVTYRFNVRSENPAVATVDNTTVEFTSATTPPIAKLKIQGIAVGTTRLIVDGPPQDYLYPSATPISVGISQPTISAYTLGKNLQASTQIDLGANFSNPNGAIVTLNSSDPTVLLLSRSSSTPGTPSVTVAVPAGDRRTQQVYFQAIGEGEATIRVVSNGDAQPAATFHIVPSWISCGSQSVSLFAGSSTLVPCSIQFRSVSGNLQGIALRSGMDNPVLQLSSSAQEVFTVTPATQPLTSTSQITLRGIAPGKGELRIAPTPGFAPAPDGSEAVPVSVTLPTLPANCSRDFVVLGKDTQVSCSLTLPTGITVTATSENPSLALVSSDEKVIGGATATAVSTGQNVAFILQGLSAFGTAEFLLRAPGYQDLRIAAVLRPSEFFLYNSNSPSQPVSLRVGNSAYLNVAMRTDTAYPSTPRAGISIPVDLLATPAGVVVLDPARINFTRDASIPAIQVRGVAVGSTLIRLTAPDGFLVTNSPISASVAP